MSGGAYFFDATETQMTVKLVKRACRGLKRMSWGAVHCVRPDGCPVEACVWVRFHKLPHDSPLRRKRLDDGS